MNQIILMGRLTKDPEERQTGQTTVVRFGIAVDRRGRDGGVDFFDCAAFGKTGEVLAAYCTKGTKILLSGRVQNNNYTAHDGTKKTAVQILVNEWEFAESKRLWEEPPEELPKENPEGFIDLPLENLAEELPFV